MNLYNLHPDPANAPYREWAFENIPELVWEKYHSQPEELKKREKALATEAWCVYSYAVDVLKGPFPAGEAVIAKDFKYAYYYARDVLEGPFPAGEAAISRSPYASSYAFSILKLPITAAYVWWLR